MRTGSKVYGPATRFGIGEWYGRLLSVTSKESRFELASRHDQGKIDCPFKPKVNNVHQKCNKAGGICSLKLYREGDLGVGIPVTGAEGSLRILCPSRFLQGSTTERWIGEELLSTKEPLSIGEIGFLRGESAQNASGESDANEEMPENVGRIDSVLMHPDLEPFRWCAVEVQAVYFSGSEMGSEVRLVSAFAGAGPPFPAKIRRPDYRSSGPKRLMPQLQIKVPTLRRWGKKMAVVVDEPFFDALGQMDDVKDPSNADIGWFVVRLREGAEGADLEPAFVRYTTLERAVEGLTAGRPVTLSEFETRIKLKLEGRAKLVARQTPAKRDHD